MRNIMLVLEYDGTDFVGWQIQPNGRSVQQELTRVLGELLQEDVNLIGAGRTDSGVHARGQAANFRTANAMPAETVLRALNGLLPPDVRVRVAQEVPEEFHARYSALSRRYRYTIVRSQRAIGRQYAWFVPHRLDAALMQRAASLFPGEHDFGSFCRVAADADHHRCTVTLSSWTEAGDTLMYDIEANRFLHGMVRALVGTMVDVGRGYTPPDALPSILEARDRGRAGMAAPPHGLSLEDVRYP
jgi:tRNA pseudouridine38-40 synthase